MQQVCSGKCLQECISPSSSLTFVFISHPDGIDSRFGLSVGSLFAVIGNKYIIDSSLPESTSFTLVDYTARPDITFYFLHDCGYRLLIDDGEKGQNKSKRFDMIIAQVLLLAYVSQISTSLQLQAAGGR
jgi:hypothetical protein